MVKKKRKSRISFTLLSVSQKFARLLERKCPPLRSNFLVSRDSVLRHPFIFPSFSKARVFPVESVTAALHRVKYYRV